MTPHELQTNCPACGKALRLGLSFRLAIGPGRAARWIGRLAVPLALATFVYAFLYGADSLGGYGTAAACLAGFLVWVVINQVAVRCPRVRCLHCKACGWRREVPTG